MKKKNKLHLTIIIFVVLLLLSLGYAFLTTTLTINGTTNIDSNTWDIHLENIYVEEDSVSATAPTIDTNKTTVTYSVHLSKPGDFYEFDIDVRNSGTLDAMIESVTSKINNQAISNLPNYLDYSVKYYDDIDVVNNQLLKPGDVETYKIHIGYKENINASDLPSTNQTLNLSFSINEAQATSSAVTRNSNYLYTASSIYQYVGSAIPNGVTTYSNYNDAITAYGHPIFIRQVMKNNIIIESFTGIIVNGNVYYLKGKEGAYTYNYNKNIAQSVFGTSNCTEIYNDQGFNTYNCALSGKTIYFDERAKNQSGDQNAIYLCEYSIIDKHSKCFEQ